MARNPYRQKQLARDVAQTVYNFVFTQCTPDDQIPPQVMGPVMAACSAAAPAVMEEAGVRPTSELRSIMAAYLTGRVLEALSTLDHDEFDAFAQRVMAVEQGGPAVSGPDGAPLHRPGPAG